MADIGHNGGPPFDDIVRAALRGGLLLTITKTYACAIRDDRLERRHLRVLTEVIESLNHSTGMAYPGHKILADGSGYGERSTRRTIAELIDAGYLVTQKKAPEPGMRAVSHYGITKPTPEEYQAEVVTYLRDARPGRYGDRHYGVPVSNGADRYEGVPVRNSERHDGVPVSNGADRHGGVPLSGADRHPVGATVTRREQEREERQKDSRELRSEVHVPELHLEDAMATYANATRQATASTHHVDEATIKAAIDLYGEAAERHTLAKVRDVQGTRRKHLISRLKESGLEGWREAIAAIGQSKFLRGQSGRGNGWRADFDFLVTASKFQRVREGVYADGPDPGSDRDRADLEAARRRLRAI